MAHSRICSIDNCDKPVRTLKSGLCNAHEKRAKRHGHPLAGAAFRSPKAICCAVIGCLGDVYTSGLCSKHYLRLRRHGDAEAGGTEKGALKKWISEHADHSSDECLIWPFASKDGHGYGHLYVDGATLKAHRYMCTLAHGEPPTPDHVAAHSCGMGHEGCVNPRHLRWASRQENADDMVVHGTRLEGESAPWSKLTEADVHYIRGQRGKILQRELAQMFNVSRSAVYAIQHRRRWKHLQ